jgi:hypothetical protein
MLTFCLGSETPKSGENYNAEVFPFIIDTILLLRLFMRDKQAAVWITDTLREAAWAPLVVFIFYLVAKSFQLFLIFPPLDIPTHFLGGFAITYFYRIAIRNAQRRVGEIPFPIQVMFAFTCTGTTTIFWEFYEYVFDFFFGTHMVRGVTDTTVYFFDGLLAALKVSLIYRGRR